MASSGWSESSYAAGCGISPHGKEILRALASDRALSHRTRCARRGVELVVTMKNEALETHVVRFVRLLAAKRPVNGRVMATVAGEFREVTDLHEVEACRADEGDCLVKVRAFDSDERFSSTDEEDLARREVIELRLSPADGPP